MKHRLDIITPAQTGEFWGVTLTEGEALIGVYGNILAVYPDEEPAEEGRGRIQQQLIKYLRSPAYLADTPFDEYLWEAQDLPPFDQLAVMAALFVADRDRLTSQLNRLRACFGEQVAQALERSKDLINAAEEIERINQRNAEINKAYDEIEAHQQKAVYDLSKAKSVLDKLPTPIEDKPVNE